MRKQVGELLVREHHAQLVPNPDRQTALRERRPRHPHRLGRNFPRHQRLHRHPYPHPKLQRRSPRPQPGLGDRRHARAPRFANSVRCGRGSRALDARTFRAGEASHPAPHSREAGLRTSNRRGLGLLAGRRPQESLPGHLRQHPAQNWCRRTEGGSKGSHKLVRDAGTEGHRPQARCTEGGLSPCLPSGRPRLVALGDQGARVGVLDEWWYLAEAEVRGERGVCRSRPGLVDVADPSV